MATVAQKRLVKLLAAAAIAGASGGEGYVVRITTTTNNAIRWGYCRMGFRTP